MPDVGPIVQAPTTAEILNARGPKNAVDPHRPYAFLVEPERSAAGVVEDVATIFLTNRECPFRCLFCDLWKNTTDETVPAGAIPIQIDYALSQLPEAQSVKLYNSGNFFDRRAIPAGDLPAIAQRVRGFTTVIVENHPRLCGDDCLRFRDLIGPATELEIALGLETVHPDVLPRLNKQMTLDDFSQAAAMLAAAGIHVRAFIVLRPPYLSEEAGVDWAVRSIEFAFDVGVRCCAVIPSRAGNGIMDQLQDDGLFSPPRMSSMESVLEAGVAMQRGRVFVDLWDAERFAPCPKCGPSRIARMRQINLTQSIPVPVQCDCEALA